MNIKRCLRTGSTFTVYLALGILPFFTSCLNRNSDNRENEFAVENQTVIFNNLLINYMNETTTMVVSVEDFLYELEEAMGSEKQLPIFEYKKVFSNHDPDMMDAIQAMPDTISEKIRKEIRVLENAYEDIKNQSRIFSNYSKSEDKSGIVGKKEVLESKIEDFFNSKDLILKLMSPIVSVAESKINSNDPFWKVVESVKSDLFLAEQIQTLTYGEEIDADSVQMFFDELKYRSLTNRNKYGIELKQADEIDSYKIYYDGVDEYLSVMERWLTEDSIPQSDFDLMDTYYDTLVYRYNRVIN